jgi:quercetin dioxygenase-like cupin family protein
MEARSLSNQQAMEQALGKLVMDGGFRDAFFGDPAVASEAAGIPLSDRERNTRRPSPTHRRHAVPMKTTRLLAIVTLIATTGLALHVGQAQQVGARRVDLQRHDLSVTGREVVQTIVELAPGTTAPRHTHPGEEIIYVLEGTWEYTVEGKPPVTLKAGEVLFIPARTIHSARNVGTGRAAELATYIVEKGKPLLTVVE